jgi:hypothetical protein
VLLIEDVSERGKIFDQLVGVDVDDATPALRTLARHHAAFWDDPNLTEHPFLLRLADEPYPAAVGFAYDTAWPTTQEYLGDRITPRARRSATAPARIPRCSPSCATDRWSFRTPTAPRQPLPHRRRRGHCDRLAADRPFGRAARSLVLRERRA